MHRSSKAKVVRGGGWTSEFVESCDEGYDRRYKSEDYYTDDKVTDFDDDDDEDDDEGSIELDRQDITKNVDDGRRPLPLVTPSNPRSRLDLTLSRNSHRMPNLSSSQSVSGALGRRLDRSYFTPQPHRGTSASLSDFRDYRVDRNHSSFSSSLISSTFTPNLVSKEPARTLGDFLNQNRADETDDAPGSGSGDDSDDDDATFFSMFQWSKTGDTGASSSVQQSSKKNNISSSRSVGGRSLSGDVQYSSQPPKKSIKGSASVADVPTNDSSLRPVGSRSAYRGLYARSLEEDAAALSQGNRHSQTLNRPSLTRSVKASESRGWQSSPEDDLDQIVDTKQNPSTTSNLKTDTAKSGTDRRRPGMLEREVSERFDRFLLEKEKERRRRHRDRDSARSQRSNPRRESASVHDDRKQRRSRDANASTRSSDRVTSKSRLEDLPRNKEAKRRGDEDETATTASMPSQGRERGSRDHEKLSSERRSRRDKGEKEERERTRHSRRGPGTDDEGRRREEQSRRRTDRRSSRHEAEDEDGDAGKADDRKLRRSHRSNNDLVSEEKEVKRSEESTKRRSSHKSRTEDADENEGGRRAEDTGRKSHTPRSHREDLEDDVEGRRGEESNRRRGSHRLNKDDVNKDEDVGRTEGARRRRSDKRTDKDDVNENGEGRGTKESSKRHSHRRSRADELNEDELIGRREEASRRHRSHRSTDKYDRDGERRHRSSSRTRDKKNRTREDAQDDVDKRDHRASGRLYSKRSSKDEEDTAAHSKHISNEGKSSRRSKEEGGTEGRTESRRTSSKRHSDHRSVVDESKNDGKVSSRRNRSNSRHVPSRRSVRSKDPMEDHGRRRSARSTEGDHEIPSNQNARRSSRSDYDSQVDSQFDSNSDVDDDGSKRSKFPNEQIDDITVIQFDPTKHDNIDQVMTSKGSSIEIENLDGSWSIAHIREMPVTPNVASKQYFLSDSVTASMTSQESSLGLSSSTTSTGRTAMRLLSTCLSTRLMSQTLLSDLQPKQILSRPSRRRSYSDQLDDETEGQYRRRGITNRLTNTTTPVAAVASKNRRVKDDFDHNNENDDDDVGRNRRSKMCQSTGRAESVLRRRMFLNSY
jgi:hypothetical protein